jgi:hypothetical protein
MSPCLGGCTSANYPPLKLLYIIVASFTWCPESFRQLLFLTLFLQSVKLSLLLHQEKFKNQVSLKVSVAPTYLNEKSASLAQLSMPKSEIKRSSSCHLPPSWILMSASTMMSFMYLLCRVQIKPKKKYLSVSRPRKMLLI